MDNSSTAPQSETESDAATRNLSDSDLSAWLDRRLNAQQTVGYVQERYHCRVFNMDAPERPLWVADPDRRSKTVLKKLARKGLLRRAIVTEQDLKEGRNANPDWEYKTLDEQDIDQLIADRQQLLGRNPGRGQSIKNRIAWRVWNDAGGRCMFEGCGTDLSHIQLHKKQDKIGYLAHIVASNPNGPRGNENSHRLSTDPENIMLMCDGCHRLIDCFAPDDYPADVLHAMRQRHKEQVRFYLDSLAYPSARALTLHANLANVPTYFHESEYIEAVLATGRSMTPGIVQYMRHTQRDDRRQPGYWVNYLHEHELDIRRLVIDGRQREGSASVELAVFPLHHVPTLILAGRIVGEARATQVFQYDRQRRSWAWNKEASPQPTGTFFVEGLSGQATEEVLVSIELTAKMDVAALPDHLDEFVSSGQKPWIRITMDEPSWDCIQHPDDLDQFIRVARSAINHIQDVMRARKVHLIAISPATTLFRFGQMLQAGHHPPYMIYDRPDRESPFREAFTISGHAVMATSNDEQHQVDIR